MTPEVMEKMMRQTVPCKSYIEEAQSTWKLNQNKPKNARRSAADQVEQYNIGSDTDMLAGFLREAYKLLIIGKTLLFQAVCQLNGSTFVTVQTIVCTIRFGQFEFS